MERQSKKRLIPVVIALAVILALCAWTFGWGRGDINVMEFSANEVDRIELFCTGVHVDLHTAVVTEKDDIQAFIDSINSFQHTGSIVKELFKHGIPIGGLGGAVLYSFNVYLSNGDTFLLRFSSNSGIEEQSDMEVDYWIYQGPNHMGLLSTLLSTYTCRGSMELFYELYEKCGTAGGES